MIDEICPRATSIVLRPIGGYRRGTPKRIDAEKSRARFADAKIAKGFDGSTLVDLIADTLRVSPRQPDTKVSRKSTKQLLRLLRDTSA